MNFPEILKKLRKEKNLSQKELADKIGITGSAIGYYELDKRKPDYEIVVCLAKYFEVSCDYLVGISDEKRSADVIKEKLLDKKNLHELIEDPCKRNIVKKVLNMDSLTVKKIDEMIDIMLKN